jgi:hypothetical protein
VVAHAGMFYADTGCDAPACISDPTLAFSQTLTTVAGQNYTFSFFYDLGNSTCNGCSGSPDDPTDSLSELVAQWNGTTVLDAAVHNQPDGGYVLFSVTEMATSISTTISFSGRQDPAHLGVDDVCVDLTSGTCPVASGVPEPGSMFLFSGGLTALALAAYARRRSTKARILARA